MQVDSNTLSQVNNHIVTLVTRIDQVKTSLEQIASEVEKTSTRTADIESVSRMTNLSSEGLARKIDDSQAQLNLLERSFQQVRETQFQTSELEESIHQLVSDAFSKTTRYFEQRRNESALINIEEVQMESRRELATDLLPKLEQLLENANTFNQNQQQNPPHLQNDVLLVKQEILNVKQDSQRFQEESLRVLNDVRKESSSWFRLMLPGAMEKREQLLIQLESLINSSTREEQYQNLISHLSESTYQVEEQYQNLINHLSKHIDKVNDWLYIVREARGQLLSLWTNDNNEYSTDSVNKLELDFDSSEYLEPDDTLFNTEEVININAQDADNAALISTSDESNEGSPQTEPYV